MPETTIPEAKRKSHESRKTVDTETRICFTLTRSDIGARTERDGKPVKTILVLVRAIMTRQNRRESGLTLGLSNC
jgi:hypothetical protein